MAKIDFIKGDHVVAKKWSGEEFLGLYEYSYLDGSHCIVEVKTNRRFNAKPNDVRYADDEEDKEIKQALKTKKDILKIGTYKPTTKKIEDTELEDALASTE